MSSKHDLAHQDIAVRLYLLEGQTPPPNPNPPPAPPPSGSVIQAFDFINDTPSGVAVARTSAKATVRIGAHTMDIVGANTLRYQHDAAGEVLGLLIERATTNLFPNARNPGAAFNTLGSGVTKTNNYGTAPNGATESTRIQVSSNNSQSGVRLGISGVTDGQPYAVQLWGRSPGGAKEVQLRNPVTGTYDSNDVYELGTDWTLIELYGSVADSDFYNFDIVTPDEDPMDIQIWMCALQRGNQAVGALALPVATSGSSDTKDADVLTITLDDGDVTADVRIEYSTGITQDFLSQEIDSGAEWVKSSNDMLYIVNMIKSITFYTEGTLEGGSPPPGPTPPPAPPPSGVLTVSDMVAQMGENDESPLYNSPASGTWQRRGFVVMGADLRYASTPTWWGPGNDAAQIERWLAGIPWFVVWDGAGHGDSLNCRVALRDIEFWTANASMVWTRRFGPGQVSGESFARNLQGSGTPGDDRREADGSLSVRFNHSSTRVYHGWGGKFSLPDEAFKAIQIRLKARKILHDPSGSDDRSSAVYLVSVGGDAYPGVDVNNGAMGVSWNPGIGGSRFKYVTNDWQPFIFTTLDSAEVDNSPRSGPRVNQVITTAQLTANPPPLDY